MSISHAAAWQSDPTGYMATKQPESKGFAGRNSLAILHSSFAVLKSSRLNALSNLERKVKKDCIPASASMHGVWLSLTLHTCCVDISLCTAFVSTLSDIVLPERFRVDEWLHGTRLAQIKAYFEEKGKQEKRFPV